MKIDPRKFLVLHAIAVACLAWAGAAEASISYRLTEIGGVAADDFQHSAEATSLNGLGQAAGNIIGFRDESGFVDNHGAITSLSGDTYTQALGINDAGTVVGFTGASPGEPRQAYRASGGVLDPLPTLGGMSSEAAAINNAGQIAGSSRTASGQTHAFRYTNGTVLDLQTLGGTTSRAFGINAAGDVTGLSSVSGDTATHAFLYSGSTMHDIDTLHGVFSRGNDVNDAGQVTGSVDLGSGIAHAFLYSGSTMRELLSKGASVGNGINDAGVVVGTLTDSAGDSRAFVYANGAVSDLNTLLDPISGAGWTLLDARDVNDRGQIVGSGVNADGKRTAFLLTPITVGPVPEPQTCALMLAGLGLLGAAKRRGAPAAARA